MFERIGFVTEVALQHIERLELVVVEIVEERRPPNAADELIPDEIECSDRRKRTELRTSEALGKSPDVALVVFEPVPPARRAHPFRRVIAAGEYRLHAVRRRGL